ncbi:MAG: ABC transporter permease [Chloroflexi bacterium]|nr:MAG: ABC transporter permease [Chloroflexota bacterium]
MRRYLIQRIGQNLFTFFLFLTLVYLLLDAQPGDFGNIYLNDSRLTAEQRQVIREQLGLNRPVMERYLSWLGSLFQGDLGLSFSNSMRPVISIIAERAPRTIILFLSVTILANLLGFAMGKMLAWRRGGAVEYAATIAGVGLFTVFVPWFALMMIWLFAYKFNLFPLGKFIDPVLWREATVEANTIFLRMMLTGLLTAAAWISWLFATRRFNPGWRKAARWVGTLIILTLPITYWATNGLGRYAADILHHIALPVLTITIVNFAGTMLLTRSSMLETLREDYIMAARAKGLPEAMIRDKHAARNAMLPTVTSFILALAFVMNGGVITETIFSWPGMGLTLLKAAQTQDIPLVIGSLVFTGALALTAHLGADLLYAFLDPRIRVS